MLLRGHSQEMTVVSWDPTTTSIDPKESAGLFLGDSEAFKKLCALPLTSTSATFAVHRVGDTLVVDSGNDDDDKELAWPRSAPLVNGCLRQEFSIDDGRKLVQTLETQQDDEVPEDDDDDEGVEESKSSLLEEEEEEVPTDDDAPAVVEEASSSSRSPKDEIESIVASALAPYAPFLEEEASEDGGAPKGSEELDVRDRRDYGSIVPWRLGELRLVSGSDVVCVSDGHNAGVTLRLAPADAVDAVDQETRRLAVLDYWLENVLAGAPRLALCLEQRGVIVGGRLVATSDISTVLSRHDEGALFDPTDVEAHVVALLRFLYEHCNKDGATYVLRRDENGGVLKLFDVAALCDPTKRRWQWFLATLSVRFARQIDAHLTGTTTQQSQPKAAPKKPDDDDDSDDKKVAFDPRTVRELRCRQRLLLETALELFAELADLDGGKHLLMRASVEEQLAGTYLHAALSPGPRDRLGLDSSVASSTKNPVRFFCGISPPLLSSEKDDNTADEEQDQKRSRLATFDGMRTSEAGDIEAARKHLRSALELVSDADVVVFAETAHQRQRELRLGVVDCSLALARRHLDAKRPSNLMHELKSAAQDIQHFSEVIPARRAALWHTAAAFAFGVAADRFAWSEAGAHATDAFALIQDIADALSATLSERDAMVASFARDALADLSTAERCVTSFLGKKDLARLRATANKKSQDPPAFDASSSSDQEVLLRREADEQRRTSSVLELLTLVAGATGACLGEAKAAFGAAAPEVRWISSRLADACSRIGATLSEKAQEDPRDWLVVALARGVLGLHVDDASRRTFIAMVRLNWCVTEGRASSLGEKEDAILEALRHAEAAALTLENDDESILWRQTHAQVAQMNLLLGVSRRRAGRADVVEPLIASLRASEKLHGPGSSQAAAAKYQLGSFLGSRVAHGYLKAFDDAFAYLQDAKKSFLALGFGAHAVLCAVALSDLLEAKRSQTPDSADHALAALAELVDARHPLLNADPATVVDATRQVKDRLPARAKTLLQHTRSHPHLAAHAKAAYKAALTTSDVGGALSAIADALQGFRPQDPPSSSSGS